MAAALAAQVAGGLAATATSGRLPALPILLAAGLADFAITRVLGGPIGSVGYLAGVAAFGFLWLFAMPFQTRLLIDLDPSRRSALQLPTAQLLGSAAGPAVTSAVASQAGMSGALDASAVLFAAAAACIVVVAMTRSHRAERR